MASCDEELQSLSKKIFFADSSKQDDIYRVYVNAFLDCRGNPENDIDPEAIKVSTPEALVALAREIVDSLGFSKEGINTLNTENQLRALIGGYENDSEDAPSDIHKGADPVMMFNGQFVHDVTDLMISGAGMDFVFIRTYKNQVTFNGPLGFNWTHNFHVWLRVANETIFRTTADLREEAFTRHPKFGESLSGHFDYWIPPDGKDGVIFAEGNSFVLRLPSGVHYIFEPDPAHSFLHRLRQIKDRHGNFLTLNYSEPDGLLQEILVNHERRVVTFIYDEQQRIRTIRDFTGRQWQYAYDSIGDLIAVTTPATDRYPCGLTVQYDYSSAFFTGELQHNLIRIIDAAGQIYLENEYGTQGGLLNFNRVVRQRQGSGEYRFEYEDFLGPLDFDYPDEQRPAHVTILVERNGQPVHHIYNRFGNLLRREQRILQDGLPRDLVEQYRYNRAGNIVASLSPEGVLTQSLYGRDYFVRQHGLTPNGEVPTDSLTWRERQAFGCVLATVRRDGYAGLLAFSMTEGIFGNFPDIFNGIFPPGMGKRENDIIVKLSYEDEFGQLRTVSDPRFTNSPDPNALNEHPRHQETLTEYFYGELLPSDPPNRFLVSIKRPTPTLPNLNPGDPVVDKFTQPDPNNPTQEIPAYDSHGRLLRHTNPVRSITEYAYFPADPTAPLREGYLQRTIADSNDLAITTEYEVDVLGRVVATTLPRSVEVTDGRFVIRTSYNDLDQMIETINSQPFAFRTHSFFDRNGKLERQERELRDENGNEILGGNEVHTYCYDQEFNLLEETLGGVDVASHLVTSHRYNAAGQLALTTLPEKNQIQYRYDERRLLVAITRGVCTEDEITIRTEYDGDGRVRRTIDARGNPTDFTWDAFGREIVEEDSLGHITLSNYDKAGNLLCTRVFEKRPEGYFLLARSETEYDELNRAIRSGVNKFDEPLGPFQRRDLETTFLASPGPGKLLTTQTFYDAKGRVLRTLDSLLRESRFTYDALDRVVVATDPLGNETRNRYDGHGNLVRGDQVDPVYDVARNVIGQRVFSSSFTYDELDRLNSSVDSLGNMTRLFYDSRGNRVRQVDPLGNVVRTDYDIFDRRASIHQELTDNGLGSGTVQDTATTGYEYDRNGNQIGMADARGNRTAYRYDALDRKRATVYPDKSEFLFDYDKDGNLIRTTDNNGLKRLYTVDSLGRTTRVDVDKSGLMATVTVEGATFERYEYDGLGRRIFEENDFANCTIHYNSLGWILSETMNFTTIEAPLVTPLEVIRDFNDVGALTDLTYPNGRRLHFDRDDLNRLTRIKNVVKGTGYPGNVATPDSHEIVTKIEYAGRQRRRCVYGNGSAIGYAHDGAGRLIEIAHTSAGGPLLTMQYLFDAIGNMRTRHDMSPTRNEAEKFAFDSFYRLAGEAIENRVAFDPTPLAPAESLLPGPIPNRQSDIDNLIGSLGLPPDPRTYGYDLVGNRQSEQLLDGTLVDYGVNELDQYSSRNGIAFAYEKNGTLRSDDEFAYFYDSLDRLTRVENTSSHKTVIQFFHDARGRRILEVSNSLATHLVWSGDNQIAEYRNGTPFALYVFDDGVDRPLQIVSAGADHWYHADLVGSVRLMTDQTGNESVSYRYATFGLTLEETNSLIYNPLRYTARRFDGPLGTYDFRARQYNPSLGKFIQRDPKAYVDGSNLYVYAKNNPLIFRDPHGSDSRPEQAVNSGTYGAQDPTDYVDRQGEEKNNDIDYSFSDIFNDVANPTWNVITNDALSFATSLLEEADAFGNFETLTRHFGWMEEFGKNRFSRFLGRAGSKASYFLDDVVRLPAIKFPGMFSRGFSVNSLGMSRINAVLSPLGLISNGMGMHEALFTSNKSIPERVADFTFSGAGFFSSAVGTTGLVGTGFSSMGLPGLGASLVNLVAPLGPAAAVGGAAAGGYVIGTFINEKTGASDKSSEFVQKLPLLARPEVFRVMDMKSGEMALQIQRLSEKPPSPDPFMSSLFKLASGRWLGI